MTLAGNAVKTFSGIISDSASASGSVTKQGTGTLTLMGTNTFDGPLTISNGTVSVGAGSGIGSIATSSVVNSGTLIFNRSDDLTYAGVVSGSGTLQKSGTGTLTLSGANTYGGKTTIDTSGGNITVSGTGSLGTVTAGVATYAGAIELTSSTSTFTFASSTTQEFSGVISLAGALTKSTGTGTLTLSGNNSYTGLTSVTTGTVKITHANALGGSTGNSQRTVVSSGATLEVGAVTSAEPLNIRGAGVGTPAVGAVNFSGAGTLSGTVAMSADSTVQVATDTTGRIGGIVSGASLLTKTGAGTLELTATNTYSGGTTISAGTLSVGAGGTAGDISGNVTNSANITFNRSNVQSFAGVISGSGTLTKLGADTLTLTGDNTYTGGTTISAGTLRIGAGSNAGAIAGNVTNNATLNFNRSDAVTFAGTISGTGAVTKSGSNTLTLTANSTYTGATTLSGGALVLQNDAPSTGSSSFSGAGSLTIEPSSSAFASAFSTTGFNFGGTLTGLTLGKSGNNVDVTVATTASIAGPVTIYAKDITVSAAVTAASSNVSLNATGQVTQGLSAAITGSGLAMNGTGTFTLTNTSNNVSTIAAGTSSARAASVSYRDSDEVTIGSVNPTGIWSSGDVLIETTTGNLTFSESINTTSTSPYAVTLNAGVSSSAGTSTGGNIIVSGSPTIAMGSGGIARLFSGSVDSSTNLTTFIGSGTGRFRYNSDEVANNYTLALSSGNYAIYRERPTLTVTASAQTLPYGTAISTSSFTVSGKNSDTAAQAFSANPSVSVVPALPYPRGTHTLTASGGTEVLGYNVSYTTGTLTVTTKTLTITGSLTASNKVYDGTDTATIATNSLSLVGVEGAEVVTLTPALAFNDRNVGDGKRVSITSSSTLDGTNAGNYSLSVSGAPWTTANVTAKSLSVSGLSSINKEYDGLPDATVTGTAVLQTAIAAGAGTSDDGKPYSVDSVSVTGTPTAAFNSKNVTAATTVSFTGLSLTGSGNGNYTLAAHPTVSRVITAKALTMTGT
nr:hypothetical protein [Actinomycetota bacterium]